MDRRELIAAIGTLSTTTLTGCFTANERPSLEVTEVVSNVPSPRQINVRVRVENYGDGIGHPTLQAKIERGGETVTTKRTGVNVHPSSNSTPVFRFEDVGTDGEFSRDEYTAYGRIKSRSWIRATTE